MRTPAVSVAVAGILLAAVLAIVVPGPPATPAGLVAVAAAVLVLAMVSLRRWTMLVRSGLIWGWLVLALPALVFAGLADSAGPERALPFLVALAGAWLAYCLPRGRRRGDHFGGYLEGY